MITLYGFSLSGHSHRVELFLTLLGLPFQRVEVDLVAGEQRLPEFLARNAFGEVPVIDDGGALIADSNAILSYLALRYAPPSWLPRDPLGAARVQRWLSAAAGLLAFGPARARAAALFGRKIDLEQPFARAKKLFAAMEETLAGGGAPFIAGTAEATIADLALYAYTARAPEGGISLDAYPALRDWLGRVEALPGFLPMPVSGAGGA